MRVVISPGIQRYRDAIFEKSWNPSNPFAESTTPVMMREEYLEPILLDSYYEDKKGNRITSINFQNNYSNFISAVAAPQGGDAETNYHYADGSIISYGQAYGYRRYALTSPNDPNDLISLVRMPDNLNINFETGLNNVRATFTYRNTARRYCNPACFAGFIGVLIQLGRTDVVCTGMCFGDATSYPSVTHPNGDSVDTAYLATLAIEQLKVDAFRDYYFTNILRGNISWYPQLTNTAYSNGHNDHLHSGDFDLDRVLATN